MAEFHSICTSFTEMFAANDWKTFQSCFYHIQYLSKNFYYSIILLINYIYLYISFSISS
jgi:hypothetical protein